MSIVIINGWGFFSNFLKFLNWMMVKDRKLIFHCVDKGQNNDCDTRIHDKENIWENMFLPIDQYTKEELYDKNNIISLEYPCSISKFNQRLPDIIRNINNGYIYCMVDTYKKDTFESIRKLFYDEYSKLKWTDNLKLHVNIRNVVKYPSETLAITIRCSRHYGLKPDYNVVENILPELENIMKNYKYLLVLTTIKSYYQRLCNVFGSKILFVNNKTLVDDNTDWSDVNVDYKTEFIESFTDVYMASTCDMIVGGSSNMLLGALVINPTLKYKIFDVLNNCNGQ